MFTIARALENGNPFVYLFFVILFIPPVMIILFAIYDKIVDVIKNNKNN